MKSSMWRMATFLAMCAMACSSTKPAANSASPLESLVGPTGSQGLTRSIGAKGVAGVTGAPGYLMAGAAGAKGLGDFAGAQGSSGEAGTQGYAMTGRPSVTGVLGAVIPQGGREATRPQGPASVVGRWLAPPGFYLGW
jgi:hypothetical protein